MIKYDDKKMTATQLAKTLVMERGAQAAEFWGEFYGVVEHIDGYTEREKDAVYNAIVRQLDRVANFLGMQEW